MKYIFLLFFIFSGLLLKSCSKKVSPATLKASDTIPHIPAKHYSYINLPITVDLSFLEDTLNHIIPDQISSGNSWITESIKLAGNFNKDFQYRYFAQRTPLEISTFNNRVTAKTSVKYGAEGRTRLLKLWNTSCGIDEPERELQNIGFAANISITPDWNLQTEIIPLEIYPINRCRLTAINFDVTNKLKQALQTTLSSNTANIQTQIHQSFNLRQIMEQVWGELNQPQFLQENFWFNLNPGNLYLSDISSDQKKLKINSALHVTPQIIFSETPYLNQQHLLPAPQKMKDIPEGFDLIIKGGISFDEASLLIKAQTDSVLKIGKRTLFINDLKISGSGHTMFLRLDVSGALKGTLCFIGKPIYDAETKKIKIVDFDYSLKTKNLISNVADWLKHSHFKKTINNKLEFDVAKELEKAKESVTAVLNKQISESVNIQGLAQSFEPLDIIADQQTEYINIYLRTTGDISLTVQ